jgi:hypothetical protein
MTRTRRLAPLAAALLAAATFAVPAPAHAGLPAPPSPRKVHREVTRAVRQVHRDVDRVLGGVARELDRIAFGHEVHVRRDFGHYRRGRIAWGPYGRYYDVYYFPVHAGPRVVYRPYIWTDGYFVFVGGPHAWAPAPARPHHRIERYPPSHRYDRRPPARHPRDDRQGWRDRRY